MPHSARFVQPALIDHEPRSTALPDVSQRSAWRRGGRARRSAAQPERAVCELHKLPYQDSRVSNESGLFPLTNLSHEKAQNAQNVFAATESSLFLFESFDDRCSCAATVAFAVPDQD